MNKLKHLGCALWISIPLCAVSAILIAAGVFVAYIMGNSHIATAIVIGIVCSCAATLFLRISDRYCISINAYESLKISAREMVMYATEKTQIFRYKWGKKQLSFDLRQRYFQMCIQTRNILYEKDAAKLVAYAYQIVCAIDRRDLNIQEAISNLDNALKHG